MTTYINRESNNNTSNEVANNNVQYISLEAQGEVIHAAFTNMSDHLDEGKTDAETFNLVTQFKEELMKAASMSLIPGAATPTSLIPGALTPTSLIPMPTILDETLSPTHKRHAIEKLFAWIRIYTLNAVNSMPGTMLENSNAIQQYMTQGLNKLSEVVMKDSQTWSDYGQGVMSMIQKQISGLVSHTDTPSTNLINSLTGQFNEQNTQYQSFLEKFSSLNDGINQTTTTTTQTQTLNNQNITQGPLAMITMLTQCWSVIA